MPSPRGAGVAEISVKSYYLDFWGQMHIFVKFLTIFYKQLHKKTEKKLENEFFMKMLKNLKKSILA